MSRNDMHQKWISRSQIRQSLRAIRDLAVSARADFTYAESRDMAKYIPHGRAPNGLSGYMFEDRPVHGFARVTARFARVQYLMED